MNNDKQVVLITGAAGGLGQTVARAFADSGATLAITDGSRDRLAALQEKLGLAADRCFSRAADITNRSATQSLCAAVLAACGRIDVVLHLAGGFRMSAVHETSDEAWDFLFNLNARSVLNLAASVVPIMQGQRSGCIIHIGSRAALKGEENSGVYAASKAVVVRLTESMAAELRDSGIRVNCVLPSTLDTPANRQAMPGVDPTKWVTPQSLSEVLLFLASPAARDISGAALPVYGRA